MTPRHYLRLAARESRRSRGRIALFMGCIIVGVAAIVLVAGLSASLTDGIRAEGRSLMAADLAIESRRPLPDSLDAALANSPVKVERSDIREFVSVVVTPDARASQLAEIKVVDSKYPFYGTLTLEKQDPPLAPPRPPTAGHSAGSASDHSAAPRRPTSEPSNLDPPTPANSLSSALTDTTTIVAPELLARLNLKPGDTLNVGGAPFRIAAAVTREPDKVSISFTLGPRVFLSHEGLARTRLLGRGARVEYRALLKLPDNATAADAELVKQRLESALAPSGDSFRVRTFLEAQPALRRSFDRVGRYLGLVGLLSLLIGGVGVAQVARAWLAARMDDIAILRCLGATPREVVVLFLLQVLALALVASLTGAALGTAFHYVLPKLFPTLVPADLVHPWQPAAVLRGVLLGLAVATVFTLPHLLALRRVPPVRVLRRDTEPARGSRVAPALASLLILAAIWAAATLQSESPAHGGYFAAGVVATVAVLALAASLVSRLARLLPRDVAGVRLRHGLAHLARPGAATVGAIVALGLGVTFVFATWVVERRLSDQLTTELPADAPSTFFVDVQPDQWPGIERILTDAGAAAVESRPIVTARFSAVDNIPVADLANRPGADEPSDRQQQQQGGPAGDSRPRPRRWALTREHRVTYGTALPRGNRILAGQFPSTTRRGVSLEEGFARDLGVTVGSPLTLDVQGVPVDLTVTSIRAVDWRTMGMNFFIIADPGPLDDAPQSRLATARIGSADLPRIQAAVVSKYPNVTVIHVREVVEKVLVILRNVGLGIRALGAFTIAAGVIVLGGTVAATQARRAREVALLKTVGMTRRDVVAVYAVEYALTGLVAAAVGIAAASALSWAVLTRLMDLPWSPRPLEITAAALLTITLAVLAGLAASARALSARPVEVLRSV